MGVCVCLGLTGARTVSGASPTNAAGGRNEGLGFMDTRLGRTSLGLPEWELVSESVCVQEGTLVLGRYPAPPPGPRNERPGWLSGLQRLGSLCPHALFSCSL